MTNFRWTVCGLLFFATMAIYMDRLILSLTWKDFIAPEFGWDDSDYAKLIGIFSLVYAGSMPIIGRMLDRGGMRKGLSWSIAICSVGAILHAFCGLLTSGIITNTWFVSFEGAREALHNAGTLGLSITTMSIYLFMGCRTIMAFGQAGVFPAAISITADYFPKKDRAFATSIFNNGACVGSLLAPLIIPPLASYLGWEMAFLSIGSIGFIWMILWLAVYEKAIDSKRVNSIEYEYIQQDEETLDRLDDSSDKKEKPMPLRECLSSRHAWAFIIGKFLTDGAWWFYVFWAPLYLSDTYGYPADSPMGMALVFCIYLICLLSVIGGYMPSYLTNKGNTTPSQARLKTMLIFACIQLIGIFEIRLGSLSPWILVIVIGILGFAHQSWSANLFSIVGDSIPKKSIATVVGIGGFAGGISSYLTMRLCVVFFIYAEQLKDSFIFFGSTVNQGAYTMIFSLFSIIYLIAWAIIKIVYSNTNNPFKKEHY